jgi:ABC-type branched-subunit amino acid transport system substrate-binding protein
MAVRSFGVPCGLLVGLLSLSGCVAGSEGTYVPPQVTPNGVITPPVSQGGTLPGGPVHVALLAPLTGANAAAGDILVKAAQLALAAPGAPTLDVKDTGSTPVGAAEAARAAIAAGDSLIMGPLTSAETASVGPVAESAHVPVLAFTSDSSQAQPGVWVLGLTPAQQTARLVQAAAQEGRTRIAALLPENGLGAAMGQALTRSAAAAGLPPPQEQTYGDGMSSITQAVQAISDYADRRGPIDAQIRQAKQSGDKAAIKAARDASRQAIASLAPLPFDALLLADTSTPLAELGTLLPYYDVSGVQIMGPALWAQPDKRAGAGGVIQGAWYAAFDPAVRVPFVTAYTARYGDAPPMLADFAFDAASIARVTSTQGASLSESLTRPGGFTGANGAMLLLPDGRVLRALAVFRIDGDQASIVAPAPATLAAPSS